MISSRKKVSGRAPLWLLVLITLSGTLAMHMFVPAMPEAAADLHASLGSMQMTISLYILGLAVGQLVYGPLSDSFGRRPLLLIGLLLYLLAGVVAAIAQQDHTLIAARLFQALGGCAGLALGRAIVRDMAVGDSAVKDLALLNLIMMVGPGLAPLLGSFLTLHLGWRSVFYVLVALGAFTLFSAWYLLPETGSPAGKFRPRLLLNDYGALLRSGSFVGFAIGGGAATTAIYAYIAAAPFIITNSLHRPAGEVGFYLALLVIGLSIGNAATRQLVGRFSLERILIGGNATSVIASIILLGIVLSGHMNVISMSGLMVIFALGAGMTSPAALTKGLNVDKHLVGSAAGLYGFTQMAIGAICTSLVGLGQDPAVTSITVLACSAMLGQTGLWFGLKRERRLAPEVLHADTHVSH